MPPSVASTQLLNTSAHATNEPLRTLSRQPFLEMCCTNNTQPRSSFFRKPLFHHAVLNKPHLRPDHGVTPRAPGFPLTPSRLMPNRRGAIIDPPQYKERAAVSVMEPLLAKFPRHKSTATTSRLAGGTHLLWLNVKTAAGFDAAGARHCPICAADAPVTYKCK